jgi:hypothetical protein
MPGCPLQVIMIHRRLKNGAWIMVTDVLVAIGAATLISFSVWLFVFEPRRDIHDL